MAMQAMLEAIMRGNAEAQGQAQAKKIASDQMDANENVKLAFTGKKTAGGVPVVTFTGPADLLNQTQDSDVAEAYARPKINVETALEERGFRPKTPFVNPEDVDTFGERYRARRELGGGVLSSALMAGVARGRTDDRLQENLANTRAAKNSANYQKFVKPVVDEEQDEAQLIGSDLSRRNSLTTQDRLLRQEQQKRLDDVLKNTDFSLVDPKEWGATAAEQLGIEGEIPRHVSFAIERKGRQDLNKALDGFLKNSEALGQHATWDEAKATFGRPVANYQDAYGQKTWQAARDKFRDEETREMQKVVRESRALAIEARKVEESERAGRREASRITKEEKAERQKPIDSILSVIRQNAKEIADNSASFAKLTTDEGTRKHLQERNRALVQHNEQLATDLEKHGVTVRRPNVTAKPAPKPAATPVEYATQAEWDALIDSDETPETLKKSGIALRK